jgi:hypothetical protein
VRPIRIAFAPPGAERSEKLVTMSTPPPEDILNQRRLRAAEIALETARRRRFETDETVRALQAEIIEMEATVAAAHEALKRERRAARAEVELAQRAQLLAEQGAIHERERRWELERELNRLRRDAFEHDALSRQLIAEQRIRALEGELEVVFRRAAEFEYGVRMAAFDAFKLVRELVDRVSSVLPNLKLGLPELGRGDPEAETPADGADPASANEATSVERAANRLDSQRLDAALERLRASTPPPADPE